MRSFLQPPRRLFASLTNRIFLACAALAVLSIGIAIFLVNAAVIHQAEEELERGLEDAAALVEEYRRLLFEHFTREARLVADLPKLKAAVFEDHPPTIEPIAADYQRQIGADLFVVTNARGRVLAQIGAHDLGRTELASLPAVRSALEGRAATSYWPLAGAILQVVAVPVWIDPAEPEILGTLTVGFSLDRRMALQFQRLTNSEIAFAMDGRIRASTLGSVETGTLAALLEAPGISRVVLDDEDYVAIASPLPETSLDAAPASDGGAPARGELAAPKRQAEPDAKAELAEPERPVEPGTPAALILRSRTAALRLLDALQTALAGTALIALLAATVLSYAVARSVTRPLGTITSTMREIAATGDLTRRIPLPEPRHWEDEDTRLVATTFNALAESIARFQREAAQRERLSSLGRLSTVVAHEIRNPLMIMKAALRTLRRDGVGPAEIRTAVADIDEEVVRLNRIVTEVLDFARPIRFELAEADLNRLCEDAAAAAAHHPAEGRDGEPPGIRLRPAPGGIRMTTDAERLRLALVNILANARQAVLARGEAGPAGLPPVELTTTVLPGDRAAVTIADRGVGIRPEDLPRVFDPYFTTKRTGSGLGLAIARNVIEGLGGTIGAASEPDRGTEIRIELPRTPPAGGEADPKPPAAAQPLGAGS